MQNTEVKFVKVGLRHLQLLTLHALGPPLCSENELTDCTSLRGILIALSLGLIPDVKVCPKQQEARGEVGGGMGR